MEIRYYVTRNGKTPFIDWLKNLRDQRTHARIYNRIDRLRLGLAGDCKAVGEGVYELRIHYGPGYRIYFPRTSKVSMPLLCGGSKASQQQDIAR